MKVQLRGWATIPAIVVVLLFLGYRAMSARSVLDGEQGELLRGHLQGEYTSLELPNVRTAYADGYDDDAVDRILSLDEIEFTEVRVKGASDEVIVQVTIEVAGGPPPDGASTRYYLLRHSTIGGWKVVREVGAMSFYLKLF